MKHEWQAVEQVKAWLVWRCARPAAAACRSPPPPSPPTARTRPRARTTRGAAPAHRTHQNLSMVMMITEMCGLGVLF